MTAEIDRHILVKYDIKRRIGKGVSITLQCPWLFNTRYSFSLPILQAYGIVWKSVDRRTGEIVALKKIFDAFANSTDAQRTFREILFLQAFSNHPNVIQLINVIRSSTDKDIYLVFEFMGKTKNSKVELHVYRRCVHVAVVVVPN